MRNIELACAIVAIGMLGGLLGQPTGKVAINQPTRQPSLSGFAPVPPSGGPGTLSGNCIKLATDMSYRWPQLDMVEIIERACFGPWNTIATSNRSSAARQSSTDLACTRARRTFPAVPRQVTGCLLD